MRKSVAVLSVLCPIVVLAAPVVMDVTLEQDRARQVRISYRVTGEPAIVTVDIRTNDATSGAWVSIGEANLKGFEGDVYTLQQPNPAGERHVMTWNPLQFWPGMRIGAKAGGVRAFVTAWPTNSPPDYMLVDLRSPFGVRWYPSAERLPYGPVTESVYKNEYLVMRRIPARGVTWWMGTCENATGYSANERMHEVSLSHDYYIGVYPVTVAQYARFTATDGATTSTDCKPKGSVKITTMRGSSDGLKWPTFAADGTLDWETSSTVDSTSTLGKMRDRYRGCGIRFDMPTEAQWEYACRGGLRNGYLYSGKDYTKINADALGYFEGTGTVMVGGFEANAWGLYDMVGNIMEACLDIYQSFEPLDQTRVYQDPVGAPLNGTNKRVFRGGYYGISWKYARVGYRGNSYSDSDARYGTQGYRLAWTLR